MLPGTTPPQPQDPHLAPGDSRQPIRADMLPPEIGAITPTVLKWDKGGEIMSGYVTPTAFASW